MKRNKHCAYLIFACFNLETVKDAQKCTHAK